MHGFLKLAQLGLVQWNTNTHTHAAQRMFIKDKKNKASHRESDEQYEEKKEPKVKEDHSKLFKKRPPLNLSISMGLFLNI